ncbi:MAG: hypothetical protein GY929_09685 [Actinomycetia bacterium]|nr:hypothetical protein [Actinomycetes bacterium]
MPLVTARPPPLTSLVGRIHRLPALAQLVIGLVAFGVGLAMMIGADLGLAPWDIFHQGLSDVTGAPIGTMIIAVGAVLVLALVALREPLGVGTLLNVVVIGLVVDLTLWALDDPVSLWARIPLLVLGPVITALGTGLYIGVWMGTGPRDGIMTAMARRGIPLWLGRTGLEAIVFVAGLLLGGTLGVGTVWFLVAIGPMSERALRALSRPHPDAVV